MKKAVVVVVVVVVVVERIHRSELRKGTPSSRYPTFVCPSASTAN
jgi:hypothetical protein